MSDGEMLPCRCAACPLGRCRNATPHPSGICWMCRHDAHTERDLRDFAHLPTRLPR